MSELMKLIALYRRLWNVSYTSHSFTDIMHHERKIEELHTKICLLANVDRCDEKFSHWLKTGEQQ